MRRERLQRELHGYPRGDIKKRSTIPQGTMQRRELTGRHRHRLGHKVGLHEFRVMLHCRIQGTKNYPLACAGVIQGLPERCTILMYNETTHRRLRQRHMFYEECGQGLTVLHCWHLGREWQIMLQLKTT